MGASAVTVERSTYDDAAQPILEARGIEKRYDAVVALDGAELTLLAGEVHALMGDNGAGKSTLIKSIAGVVTPDSGTIAVDGVTCSFSGPSESLALGIETVYQDLALVDSLSAYENVFLGREPLRPSGVARLLRLVDRRAMRSTATDVLERIGAKIPDLNSTVIDLSGGQRQALAIARAVMWGTKIVMLDEPTAALGVVESNHVLDIIRSLRSQGVSVLMVSHNLEHVFAVADRVTVMRRGRTAGTRDVAATTADEIVGLITGANAT